MNIFFIILIMLPYSYLIYLIGYDLGYLSGKNDEIKRQEKENEEFWEICKKSYDRGNRKHHDDE